MRLDLFLKLSRLVSSRTLAKEFAKLGMIKVNGSVAKASREVALADKIQISRHPFITIIRILKVPAKKQVSKKDAGGLYEILSKEIFEDDIFGDS